MDGAVGVGVRIIPLTLTPVAWHQCRLPHLSCLQSSSTPRLDSCTAKLRGAPVKKHADSDAHLSRDGRTDRQTDRHTNRQTDRAGWQTDKQVAKLTERHADRHTCRQTDRQVGRRNSRLYRQVRWLTDAQVAKCRDAGHSMKSDSVLASPDSMDSSTRQLPLIKTMSQGALPRSSTSTSPGTRRREDAALLKHTPMGYDLLVPNPGSKHEQHVVCCQTMTHSNCNTV